MALGRILAGDAGKMALGILAGQGAQFLAIVVTARLVDPAGFGEFGVAFAIAYTLGPIAALKLDALIVTARTTRLAGQLLDTAMVVATPVSALVGAGVAALLTTTGAAEAQPAVLAMGMATIVWSYAVFEAAAVYQSRRGRIRRASLGRFALGFGQAAAQVLLCLFWPGSPALLTGLAIGHVLSLAVVLHGEERRPGGRGSADLLRVVLWCRRGFLISATTQTLLNACQRLGFVVVLAAMFGQGAAGSFTVAQRLLGAPIQTVGQSLSLAYVGVLHRIQPGDSVGRLRLFGSLSRLSWLAGLVLLGVLFLLPEWVFTSLFGADWAALDPLVTQLAVGFAARLAAGPLAPTLLFYGLVSRYLAWEASLLASILLITLLAATMGAGMDIVCWIYSVILTIGYAVLWLICRSAIRERSRPGQPAIVCRD